MLRLLFFPFLFLLIPFLPAQQSSVDHWETVVYAEDSWKYFIGSNNPPSGWQFTSFNDSSWLDGKAGFGYGDNDDSTLLPESTPSIFIRKTFTLLDTSVIVQAILHMDFDDGFVAWLNGKEIARSNLGSIGDFPDYNTPASEHEAQLYNFGRPSAFPLNKDLLSKSWNEGENILAIQVNNSFTGSTDLSCIPFFSVGLSIPGSFYRPVPGWFIIPQEFQSFLLPLLMIKTNGAVIQSGVKKMVDMGIIHNGPEKLNHLEDPWNEYNGKAGIEFRGSSSLWFDKKNYALELWYDYEMDTAYSLLGMPPESDWVLHGPYSDKSLMRNVLAYHLASRMNHYAPRTRFVELFIDEDYRGVYVLLEKLKRDKNRVDINRLNPDELTGTNLTGGYIIKIDRSADGSFLDGWYSAYKGSGNQNVFFAYHYPKWEDIHNAQKDYIKTKISNFESALYGNTFKDPFLGYRAFIDVRSFIDYFILVELSKNVDGYRLSTFLHKDRDDIDPLIHMGPVWDYDLAFGNANYYQSDLTYGWCYPVVTDSWGNPFWWAKLLKDSYYTRSLKCRWEELRKGILSNDSLVNFIDSTVAYLGDAPDRNFTRWPIHGLWLWPNAFVGNSYVEDMDFMKDWILDRLAWLDINMPGSCSPVQVENELSAGWTCRVFPNPAEGPVSIEITNFSGIHLDLEIIDISGRLITSLIPGKDDYFLETLSLPPGVYVLKIKGVSEIETKKFIVQ